MICGGRITNLLASGQKENDLGLGGTRPYRLFAFAVAGAKKAHYPTRTYPDSERLEMSLLLSPERA